MLEQIQMPKIYLEHINEDLHKINSIISFATQQLELEHRMKHDEIKPNTQPAMTTYQLATLLDMLELFVIGRIEKLDYISSKQAGNG